MARLRDVPVVLKRVGVWTFAKRVYAQLVEDSLLTWAAAMAYSWLFAVFPFFIFLLSLLPYLPEHMKPTVVTQMKDWIEQSLPEAAGRQLAQNIQYYLDDILQRPRQSLLGVGLLVTLWAASGGMSMSMAALDRCYELQSSRAYFRHRALAIVLTVVVATLLIAVLLLLPIGSIAIRWAWDNMLSLSLLWMFRLSRWLLAATLAAGILFAGHHFRRRIQRQRLWSAATGAAVVLVLILAFMPIGQQARDWLQQQQNATIAAVLLFILNITRWALAMSFMVTVVAVVYHFGPNIKQRFRWMTPGGLFSIGVWLILAIAFRYYINHYASVSYNRTYGTVAGVALLLLFFYIDAAVLLIGAEINSELDFEILGVERGSRDFRKALRTDAPPEPDDEEMPAPC